MSLEVRHMRSRNSSFDLYFMSFFGSSYYPSAVYSVANLTLGYNLF